MLSRLYIADRVLHWTIAILMLVMLMGLSSQLHNVNWEVKGQLLHRQDAVSAHATLGAILLFLTLFRVVYTRMFSARLPRFEPRSRNHGHVIAATHLALNLCIVALAASGVSMLMNYEIPLSVMGIDVESSKQDFYQTFPGIHNIHMTLKSALWWLIGIHFVGIMYARK